MPAVTTTQHYLLASNLSAVYIKTQTALGVWEDPTPALDPAPEPPLNPYDGTAAIRVVGTPKFTPRGAGIIQRADVMTPWGGNQSSKTGGLGWDITLSTEFFWELGEELDLELATLTQLAPLFLASPWAIKDLGLDIIGLEVQPVFYAEEDRTNQNFAVQPFSIVYDELGGKRFEAYDCVAVPKLSWEYGQKVMIEWTIKGKWRPVTKSLTVEPVYVAPDVQAPIIGVNCSLTLTDFFENVNAVSKVTIDTGWAINDVADFRETYGFGLGFINLAASPSVEIDVADLPEGPSTVTDPGPPPETTNTGEQPDWTDAEANTILTELILTLNVGAYSFSVILANPQLAAFPTPGETNSYRTNTLKFQGIPNSTASVMTWAFTQTTA
jgi:hypothetical protein